MRSFIISLLLFLVLAGCKQSKKTAYRPTDAVGCTMPAVNDKAWYSSGKKAPIFNGLEGISFTITTGNKEAQAYFNQGLMLAYAFNHAEAARSFYEATRLDSACAMAYWGYAYVLGPNYNGGMESDNFERAYTAVQKALKLSAQCQPMEKQLIQALSTRYVQNPPADRSALDIAYSAEMKKLYAQYPSHPDIGALYAESVMNLHPWDLYHKHTKAPKEWTPEIVEVLEHLMQLHPKHPGAHHFYIHAMEASAQPEKALPSAALLDSLVPGAGHLVHMPSHIYINTGDYHAGTLANLKAVAVDSIYTNSCHAQGVYPLAYYPHNYHFLSATAALEGNFKLAWNAACKLQQHIATTVMKEPGWATLQHYYIIPYYIAIKFAQWDTILTIPQPAGDLLYPRAIWHYAQGMAFLGKNNLTAAQRHYDSLAILATDTSLKQLTIWNINSASDLTLIAQKILAAEIAARHSNWSKAIILLHEAVQVEDNLNYNEPPDWFFSVRHHLGAVLMKAQKFAEAEKVYHTDLKTWKKNGWALMGLYQALAAQKKSKAADMALAQFNAAWKHADIKIQSSSPLEN